MPIRFQRNNKRSEDAILASKRAAANDGNTFNDYDIQDVTLSADNGAAVDVKRVRILTRSNSAGTVTERPSSGDCIEDFFYKEETEKKLRPMITDPATPFTLLSHPKEALSFLNSISVITI